MPSRRPPPVALAAGLVALAVVAPIASAHAVPQRAGEAAAPKRIAAGLQLRGRLNDHGAYSGVWGYTAPDGREYALLGVYDGTSIVNIVDRANPYEVGFIPGPVSAWREIKTYREFMYIVNETGGGLQIVSLDDPENPRPVAAYLGFNTAHNITIEPRNFCAYICGSNVGEGGVEILWLGDPRTPWRLGTWQDTYAHDVHVRGDVMYVSAIQRGALYIVNIRDVRNPRVLGIIGGYPGAFTHNAWTTLDAQYVLTTDEVPGAYTRIWNISDPESPSAAGIYRPLSAPGSAPHNVFVEGNLAYIAHYSAGVRVVDISDPYEPEEIAFYDTQPASDSGGFNGCWGLYPYYRNSPGLFVALDMGEGLFVLEIAEGLVAAERERANAEDEGAARAEHEISTRIERASALSLSSRGANPLRPGSETTFEVLLDRPSPTTASVFDAGGRLVRRLAESGPPASRRAFAWDARDDDGRPVAAGTYWLSVRAGDMHESRRVVVLR